MSLESASESTMLRGLLDLSHDILIVVDPATLLLTEANATAASSLLYDREALLAMRITDLASSMQDIFFWDEVAAGQVSGMSALAGEWRRKDGALLPIEMSIRMLPAEGRTLALVVARDASAGKAVEDELAKMTSALRATLEATADGIMVTDLDGHIANINHRFARLWQIPQAVLDERSDRQIFHFLESQIREPDSYRERLDELFAQPTSDGFDTLMLNDGRVFERYTKPQYLGSEVIGKVFSFSDVTSRVRAEQDLLAAKNLAEQANRAKSEFLSQMSHELRTPLNAILGFAQLLQEEVSAEQREFTDHIIKAGWHLLGLINEVLDLAKIEAGRMTLNLEPVDVPSVVADCVALSMPIADKFRVSVQNDTKGQTTPRVQADPVRVKQMVLNLVSNAIKYNRPQGQVRLRIEAADPGFLRLAISDTGIGLSQADLEQLFQPFSRVGSKQQSVEGTGIGLAFTHKLVHLMGGSIGVSSEAGVGSQFWLDLPLAEPQAASAALQAPAPHPTLPVAECELLYLDDDAMSIHLMRSVVKNLPGATLHIADTPAGALQQAGSLQPALILCDAHLPASATAWLAELRQQPGCSTIPVIALAGSPRPGEVEQGLAAGFSRYLAKPMNLREITQSIRELLSGR